MACPSELALALPVEAVLGLLQLLVDGLQLLLDDRVLDLEHRLADLVVPGDGQVDVGDVHEQSVVLREQLAGALRDLFLVAYQQVLDLAKNGHQLHTSPRTCTLPVSLFNFTTHDL